MRRSSRFLKWVAAKNGDLYCTTIKASRGLFRPDREFAINDNGMLCEIDFGQWPPLAWEIPETRPKDRS